MSLERILHICSSKARDEIFEAYLEPTQLTFNDLKNVCASELGCDVQKIIKIVKLSNNLEIIIRNDKNVESFKDEEFLVIYLQE